MKNNMAIKKSMNSNTRSGISAYKHLIKSMNNKQETITNYICPICGNTDIWTQLNCVNTADTNKLEQ